MSEESAEGHLRGWAKAYRDTPEHRFPSDPHAEFFPADLEMAAHEIDRLRARVIVLEMVMREELHPNDCSCELNRMIVADIRERRLAAQPQSKPQEGGKWVR